MGFTYGSLIPLKLSGSIWSCQCKALRPLNPFCHSKKENSEIILISKLSPCTGMSPGAARAGAPFSGLMPGVYSRGQIFWLLQFYKTSDPWVND